MERKERFAVPAYGEVTSMIRNKETHCHCLDTNPMSPCVFIIYTAGHFSVVFLYLI